MSKSHTLNRIFAEAKENENKNWAVAANLYEKAVKAIGKKNLSKKGEVQERIGYCFFNAAFQAENPGDFEDRNKLSVTAYERAIEYFEKTLDPHRLARINHCKAMIAYVSSLATPDLSAKREYLEECWKLQNESLTMYERDADHVNVGKTSASLMTFLASRLEIEWDAQTREKIVGKALECGEKAIRIFSEVQDRRELSQAYTLSAFFHRKAAFAKNFEDERRADYLKKALEYPRKALRIAEEIDDTYAICLSLLCLAGAGLDIKGSTGLWERQLYERALKLGIDTRDNRLIADSLFGLEFVTTFSSMSQDDPDKAKKEYKRLDKYLEDAVRHYSLASNHSGMAMAYNTPQVHIEQRSGMETSLQSRRTLLEKAVELAIKGLEHALLSGSMEVTHQSSVALSIALSSLARIETNVERKRNLLEESAKHVKRSIGILKQASAASLVEPLELNLAISVWALAVSQTELANVEKDADGKKRLLEEASRSMQEAYAYWWEWTESRNANVETPHWFILGKYEMKAGRILTELYSLTGDSEFLGESIKSFERSVDAYEKAHSPSYMAEAYWETAKSFGQRAEYIDSAKSFEMASASFSVAAEKIEQLEEFYNDYSAYMHAWSEIQKARHHHTRQVFAKAKEHYEKAANLHRLSKSWKYLAPYYFAWAQLEYGEHQSRDEQSRKAIDSFQDATHLFSEAEKQLNVESERTKNEDERRQIEKLIRALRIRQEYCLGRIALEEAKIFDRQGDHEESSEKYGYAADRFEHASRNIDHDLDRRELLHLVYLCQAWQKMTQAEAEADPALYLKASQLFELAKEYSFDEKTRLLALGHSSFCKALEAGVRFEETRNRELYVAATQHLERAGNHYLRADFMAASAYAKGTHKLFDAYMYMDSAKEEIDPDKKTRYFVMAEKVLETSADSFMEAKHMDKAKQVQRFLEKVREERELAASLSEVLHAPSITSTTRSFATLDLGQETAVGLERFEHANIQVGLTSQTERSNIGEDFDVEIQIANVGKQAVLLVRIEVVFSGDFELTAESERYRVENTYLDMKGKRLDPFKTEKVKLALRPFDKGTFEIRPKVVYLDATGRELSSEPESKNVEVLEVILEERVSTGYKYLDNLLFGGIPENYAVVLTAPSCDERDLLIERFLETGAGKGEATFYVTAKASRIANLLGKSQSTFHLFICNPQANRIVEDMPNVHKLKGVENLTEINIALTSTIRRLGRSPKRSRRACIELVSDILLQHHAVQTRRWLNSLIPELKSEGFTTLAVVNPEIHPHEEVRAIVGIFDGEIDIYEKETDRGLRKTLRVKKMTNQEYSKSELPLRMEKLLSAQATETAA